MGAKKEVYNSLKNSAKEIAEARKALADIETKMKSGHFTPQYIDEYLRPKRDTLARSIETMKDSAMAKAQEIADRYSVLYTRMDDLNPADITDDAKLFNLGVKLNARDIESILERNKGNATMTQLALRYAEQNDINVDYSFTGHSQEVESMENLKSIAYLYRKWIDKEDAESVLDQYLPEADQEAD